MGLVESGSMRPPPKYPASRSVGWALVQAARLHRARMGDMLSRLGLFAGQEQVIQALASSGPLTMADLAAAVRVRPSTASKTVTHLASLELVQRKSADNDGRLVRVSLTDKGQQITSTIEHLWEELEVELLKPLDSKERKRLRRSLRRVANSLACASGADPYGLEDLDEVP